MNKNKTFWKEELKWEGKIEGGYYFRAFELVEFFERLGKENKEVVGLEFDGNNVNVITRDETNKQT